MTKQDFFRIIRTYIDQRAVEPQNGYHSNFLSINIGGYLFAIEGRNRGTGYITVQFNGKLIASDSPLSPSYNVDRVDLLIARCLNLQLSKDFTI